jgi:hypothetical protein
MRTLAVVVLAACAGGTASHSNVTRPDVTRPDVTRIDDARAWQVINAEAHTAIDHERRTVALAPVGGNRKGSNVGLALVTGVTFAEGAIDVDLRGQGEANASFLGIAFGVTDPAHYESVYFRPFRFRSQDPVERTHAVQYIAWPESSWEALRTRSPGVYETAIAPVPDPAGWFHAHVEIGRTTVRVFVDGAPQPTLVVHRLRSNGGGVGLWVDSQEGSFANLEIHPAT